MHASGLATGLDAAFRLLMFALASLGLLLVIGGSRLRDGWKRTCEGAAYVRERRVGRDADTLNDVEAENRRIMATAAMDPMAFAGGRAALAAFLVMRAHQAAVQTRLVGNPDRKI